MPRLYQGSFSSGEFAPSLWGRVDLERFKSALRVCRNMIPQAEGGVVKRPGLEFVGFLGALLSSVKLIPFKFNNEQTYMLAASNTGISIFQNGGAVLEGMDSLGGSGTPTVASGAATVVTYTGHGLTTANQIYWATGGFHQLAGRWFRVQTIDANRFTLLNNFDTAVNVDSSAYSVSSIAIDFGRVYQVPAGDWFSGGFDPREMDYTQANDKLYVSHPLDTTKVITRTGNTAWTVAEFDAAPAVGSPVLDTTPVEASRLPTAMTSIAGPERTHLTHPSGAYTIGDSYKLLSGGFDQLVGKMLTVASTPVPTATRFYVVDEFGDDIDSSGFTGSSAPVLTRPITGPPLGSPTVHHRYAVTAIDKVTFEESIATLVDLPLTDNPLDGDEIDIFWDDQADAATYRVYKAVGGIYGLIGTVEDVDPDATGDAMSFKDNGITPNLSIAPPLEANFFNAVGKYPGAVELFQQRIWFGRTDSLLRDFYASRSGSLSSFATSTINTDDDPIEQAIAGKSVQEVRYFVPLRDLVIMTSDAEWGFDTGNEGALSPSSGLVAQSFWGCARVKPVLVGDSAVFVEKSERSIRDLAFSLQNDGFASSELSIFAKHLFRGRRVVAMCYSEQPYSLLFCVMSDGRAVSCTYVRDQQIFAWATHDTNGKMQDCASVIENGVDNIYVVVERTTDPTVSAIGTYRQVERMRMVDPEFLDQGVYLDNSIAYIPFDPAKNLAVTRPRVLGGELHVELPDLFADPSRIMLHSMADTVLEALDGLSFVANSSGVSQTGAAVGKTWYRLERGPGGFTSVFRWEEYFPDNFNTPGTTGGAYLVELYGVKFGYNHLSLRGPVVDKRVDESMTRGLSVISDNLVQHDPLSTFLEGQGPLIHIGEEYLAEIETLDIDDANDPITGLPLQIGSVLARFGMAHGYKIGRDRDNLVTITDLTAEEDFDTNLRYFRGVSEDVVFPGWGRNGRTVVQSKDGFPFSLLAIIPQIEAGDVDG